MKESVEFIAGRSHEGAASGASLTGVAGTGGGGGWENAGGRGGGGTASPGGGGIVLTGSCSGAPQLRQTNARGSTGCAQDAQTGPEPPTPMPATPPSSPARPGSTNRASITRAGMTDDIRAHAEKRVKARQQFWSSSITLVVVFLIIVVVWGVSSNWHGYFWPMWPAIGFAIAIVFHALNVYGPLGQPVTKNAIDREVRRLGGDPDASN